MGFADQYFSKQKGFSPYFTDFPSVKLSFAVIIPAYCETGLNDALQALWNCTRPKGHIEVIIVVNSSENSPPSVIDANRLTLLSASQWINEHPDPAFRFLLMDKTNLPAPDAGVGLARKTGMDEALYRFNLIGNRNGCILSFDADSQCDTNYLTAVEDALSVNENTKGFCIYFEHPVSGIEFPDKIYQGIIQYELHLRYVNQFLRYTGFPFAYHTIGSCFGVRADVYAAQGGMNKRKAGEDFYFLHKIIPLGDFIDITGTRIIPSPRASDRAPFGTGAAMNKYLTSEEVNLPTYSPECFLVLRSFFQSIGMMYKAPSELIARLVNRTGEPLQRFLTDIRAIDTVMEINANCGSLASFINRFYRWFDAFRIIKFLNYASQDHFKKIPVREATVRCLEIYGQTNIPERTSYLELLTRMREIERNQPLSWFSIHEEH